MREAETADLPSNDSYETREFPPVTFAEETTRRFGNQEFNDYQSTFDGQNVPANFRDARFGAADESKSRRVSRINLPENVMTALPYLPFSIGLVAAIIELLLVPKSEAKVRFHAAQGLAAHLGIFLVATIFGFAHSFLSFTDLAGDVFYVVTTIMLIIFALKAYRGKPVHIETIDPLTEWVEEKTAKLTSRLGL